MTLPVAHGNSLHALVMRIGDLTEYEAELYLPTGFRLRYDLDPHLEPVVKGVAYLDPDDAVAGAAAAGSAQRR